MRTVGVKLTADIADYQRKFRQAGSEAKTLGGQLDKANKNGKLDKATHAAAGLGLGLLGAAGAAIKMAADFDKQMSSVRAATHASAGDMDKLRAAAIQAGKDTQYSATEAAKGIEELSKAGVSTSSILGGGLKGALSLAAAGELDVGEAAETAASAMTQFKLKGDQVPHVADLLSAAAGKAQGSVHDMGAALNQAGLIASSTGLSIEDTTGTLAAFASAGLVGSDAGTSFKTMLQSIQAPSGKTRDLMDELGISAYDASGQFIGITKFAGQLKDKLSKLTPELRANAFAQIFGSDATRAANILYEQGQDGIQGWIDKTNDAGYAAETAAMKTDNLAGDIERLKGSLETMAIEGGSGANSGLRLITKSLNALVDQFGKLPPAVSGTVTVVTGLTGVLLLAGAGTLKARAAMAELQAQLIATGTAGEAAAGKLTLLSKSLGVVAAAFVAAEVSQAFYDKINDSSVSVDKLTASLGEYVEKGKDSETLTATFGKNMGDFATLARGADQATHGWVGQLNDFASSIPGIRGQTELFQRTINGWSFNEAKDKMAALDTSLTDYMTTTNDARKASEAWNKLLSQSGMDTEQLAALLPGAYKKLGELNTALDKGSLAADGMSGAQQDAAGNTAAMTEEMKKQKAEADSLEASLEKLFKQYMSADEAAIKLKDTEKATNAVFKAGAKTLSLNTDEGRKNRGAVLDRLSAIEDMREAEIKTTGKVDEANQKYRDQVGALKKTLSQMGFNRAEIGKLINKYEAIPGKVNTNLTMTGGEKVAKQLTLMGQAQQALKKGTQVPAPLRRAFAYDAGGWTGPGDTHDVAGIVHADEFVIRKESRHKIERQAPGLLDRMNESGELGYAGGGRVTWPYKVDASKTRIPSAAEVRDAVTPAVPGGGGPTLNFIIAAVHSRFPNMQLISGYRANAHTLSGNLSYHALHRAADWPPSHELAVWWNQHYKSRTKEFISPWNDLNIHNGQRHTYTGAIYRQHNFAGGNAHDHIAMKNGGTIREPVIGVGASGRTYSFGENYQPERVTPNWMSDGGSASGGSGAQINITFSGPVGSRYELETWLTGAVDNLKRKGRI
jgi:TP901 family phage tail tape measure protein